MSSSLERAWTDDDRDQVSEMLRQGANAAAVGRQMQISRNAAIGRIMRDQVLRKIWVKVRHKQVDMRRVRARQAAIDHVEVDEPAPGAIPLFETGSRWCKWPVGRDVTVCGKILCCGEHVLPSDVYCQCHRSMAKTDTRPWGYH